MDAYPLHYVDHNVPLVTLLGLEKPAAEDLTEEEIPYPGLRDNGFSFATELDSITGSTAENLRQAFRDLDGQNAAWNSRPGQGKMGSMAFTYRNVGASIILPPHKAPPPLQSELEDLPSSWQLILHSPLSPLTPSSPLYPDGILSPLWATKHRCLIPSVILCFFSFTVDASRSSLEDNALKTQINQLKAWLVETKYTSRLAIILVCDKSTPVSAVVERLGNIRRATNLDTKTLVYMPGGLSVDETRAFVGSLLSNIHPTCMEYYRDLSKHARRKKNRASIPQPTAPPTSGTSQTLSARGWNVRYEVKLGIFAEFRGEMDAAERSYEQAYEDLMEGDVIEGISNWSTRFNEARMLADILAIRILRCLLWTNQTTSAAQSWANHKHRMQDIIDRKGKGSSTYGWQAWEATWSEVMAQLIERVEIPYFNVPLLPDGASTVTPNIFAPPERAISKETSVSPWDHLHHPGYWYSRAAKRLQSRRILASNIPLDDRRNPGETPASALANRSHTYDNYLCHEPHTEYVQSVAKDGSHSSGIVSALRKAESHNEIRQEDRTLESLRLEIAQELTKREQYAEALPILKQFLKLSAWRKEGWWQLLQDALLLTQECAQNVKDGEVMLLASWQLQSRYLIVPMRARQEFQNKIADMMLSQKPSVSLDADETVPCLTASFTFGTDDACVGDPLQAQLTLTSYAHPGAAQLTLSSISIGFHGSVAQVQLTHEAENREAPVERHSSGQTLSKVDLIKGTIEETAPHLGASLVGKADLTINPGAIHIYQFSVIPSEPHPLIATKATTIVDNDTYALTVVTELRKQVSRQRWLFDERQQIKWKTLDFSSNCSINIKPRPPKLELAFPDIRDSYFTDETTAITIQINNKETEQVDVRLKVKILGPDLDATVKWSDGDDHSVAMPSETGPVMHQRDLGMVDASSTRDVIIAIQDLSQMIDVVLDVEAVYTLASQPGTIITKTSRQDLSFARPFEANYEVALGVHPAPWRSYFELGDIRKGPEPDGTYQRAFLTARLASFVDESIILEKLELTPLAPLDDTVTYSISSPDNDQSARVKPTEVINRTFTVDVQKHDVEDRGVSNLSLSLVAIWRRPGTEGTASSPSLLTTTLASNATTMPSPPLSFDFSKPRVLASARVASLPPEASPAYTPLVHLTYTIENPSDYLLTFGVAMDASDAFAFAGPKTSSMQLVPFSRGEVRFTLLPTVHGVWIAPLARVTDIGFGEVLKVHAADGMKVERGRCMVWVPDSEDS